MLQLQFTADGEVVDIVNLHCYMTIAQGSDNVVLIVFGEAKQVVSVLWPSFFKDVGAAPVTVEKTAVEGVSESLDALFVLYYFIPAFDKQGGSFYR